MDQKNERRIKREEIQDSVTLFVLFCPIDKQIVMIFSCFYLKIY